MIENPMVCNNVDKSSVDDTAWQHQRAQVILSMDEIDLAEMLAESAVPLMAALKMGSEALIGKVMLAIWNKSIDRITDRAEGLEPVGEDAEELAIRMVIRMVIEAAAVLLSQELATGGYIGGGRFTESEGGAA